MSKKYIISAVVILLIGIGAYMFFNGKSNSNNQNSSLDTNQSYNNPTTIPVENSNSVSTSSGTPVRHYSKFPGVLPVAQRENKKAVVVTNKGTFSFEIYPDATNSASNFIFLADHDFYNGLTFHRYVPGFVIQGGDPLGTGYGGPGYKFNDDPVTKSYDKGIVAMANSGPNTNGSQFFIMLDNDPNLPPDYSIFGKVISGMNVVESLRAGDIMKTVTIENLK